TNTGTVNLSHVTVSDPMLSDAPITVDPDELAPGEEGTATITYTVTQEDIELGNIHNEATAEGEDRFGEKAADTDEEDVDTSSLQHPDIDLVKSGSLSVDDETIVYTFTVTNTGN